MHICTSLSLQKDDGRFVQVALMHVMATPSFKTKLSPENALASSIEACTIVYFVDDLENERINNLHQPFQTKLSESGFWHFFLQLFSIFAERCPHDINLDDLRAIGVECKHVDASEVIGVAGSFVTMILTQTSRQTFISNPY